MSGTMMVCEGCGLGTCLCDDIDEAVVAWDVLARRTRHLIKMEDRMVPCPVCGCRVRLNPCHGLERHRYADCQVQHPYSSCALYRSAIRYPGCDDPETVVRAWNTSAGYISAIRERLGEEDFDNLLELFARW